MGNGVVPGVGPDGVDEVSRSFRDPTQSRVGPQAFAAGRPHREPLEMMPDHDETGERIGTDASPVGLAVRAEARERAFLGVVETPDDPFHRRAPHRCRPLPLDRLERMEPMRAPAGQIAGGRRVEDGARQPVEIPIAAVAIGPARRVELGTHREEAQEPRTVGQGVVIRRGGIRESSGREPTAPGGIGESEPVDRSGCDDEHGELSVVRFEPEAEPPRTAAEPPAVARRLLEEGHAVVRLAQTRAEQPAEDRRVPSVRPDEGQVPADRVGRVKQDVRTIEGTEIATLEAGHEIIDPNPNRIRTIDRRDRPIRPSIRPPIRPSVRPPVRLPVDGDRPHGKRDDEAGRHCDRSRDEEEEGDDDLRSVRSRTNHASSHGTAGRTIASGISRHGESLEAANLGLITTAVPV